MLTSGPSLQFYGMGVRASVRIATEIWSTRSKLKGTSKSIRTIGAAMGTEAEAQVHHKANSVTPNPCVVSVIVLNVIKCSIRFYLWLDATIRSSDSDRSVQESRASPNSSPAAWVKSRSLLIRRCRNTTLLYQVERFWGHLPRFDKVWQPRLHIPPAVPIFE